MASISSVNDVPLRMFNFALSQSNVGTVTQQSSTSVTIDMNGIFSSGLTTGGINRFLGTGLSYDEQNDAFRGLVTGFEHVTNGVLDFRLSGISVSAESLGARFSNQLGIDGIGEVFFGGNDVFAGSSGNDGILGYGGNDTISGGAGNDTISAESPSLYPQDIKGTSGTGHDVVNGGEGSDSIRGGGGNDHLYGFGSVAGPDGNDTINAGPGYDYIQGNAGDDHLFGSDGSDRIQGGAGNDIISGDGEFSGDPAGNDTINGNRGDDIIDGGDGNDSIRGGQDNDDIAGGRGNDTLFGDLGDDLLRGGTEADVMTGGEGADRFLFTQGIVSGVETLAFWTHITDFQDGVDHIGYATSDPTSVVSLGRIMREAEFKTAIMAQAQNSGTVFTAQFGDDTIFYRQGCKVIMLEDFGGTLSLADFII